MAALGWVTVFHLLVDQLAALHGQPLDDELLPQADLLLVGAANQLQLESLGPQVGLQRFGGLLPLALQLAMVEQADADLAGLGGEVVDLEQLAAQHGVRAQPLQQHRHQLVDERRLAVGNWSTRMISLVAGAYMQWYRSSPSCQMRNSARIR